jgi:hypothetical protein
VSGRERVPKLKVNSKSMNLRKKLMEKIKEDLEEDDLDITDIKINIRYNRNYDTNN